MESERSEFNMSLSTIMNYLNLMSNDEISSISERKRCLVEGEQVLKAKHIICCGVREREASSLKIECLCLKTSDLKGDPHQVSCSLNQDESFSIECSCKAGLSNKCKHSVALLLHLNQIDISSLDDLSCTDTTQEWRKKKSQAKDMYVPVPLTELCHVKRANECHRKPTAEEKQSFQTKLLAQASNSALALHKKGRPFSHAKPHPTLVPVENLIPENNVSVQAHISGHSAVVQDDCPHKLIVLKAIGNNSVIDRLSKCELNNERPSKKMKINADDACENRLCESFASESEKTFYESSICITKDDALNICIKTQSQSKAPNSAELWNKLRKNRITGSTCYGLFTYDGKRGNWKTKVENHLKGFLYKGGVYTKFGTENESKALEKYIELTGSNVKSTGLVIHPLEPWLGFSPDGVVFSDESPETLLEIKCVVQGQFENLESVYDIVGIPYLTKIHGNFTLKKKQKYYMDKFN